MPPSKKKTANKKPKFQRPAGFGGGGDRTDDQGEIVVKVFLLDESNRSAVKPLKGNIVVTERVANATVTEVAQAVREALFPEE